MGMDGVDLLDRVERSFAIALDEREVIRAETVGDLCELVLARVPRAEQERCLTALAFRRVRAALVELGVDRGRVRPAAPVDLLLWTDETPLAERRATWARLAEALGVGLPPLRRAPALVQACGAVCAVAAYAACVSGLSPALALGAVANLALLLGGLTRGRRGHLRPHLTVGDLSRGLVLDLAGSSAGGFTRAQVEELVRRLVSDQLGVPLERVTLQARFVEDLRLD